MMATQAGRKDPPSISSSRVLDRDESSTGVPRSSVPALTTVGHSTHALDDFCGLLQGAGIQVIADVRSSPFSGTVPQFNEPAIREGLALVGISYVPMGAELGGRPHGPGLYDEEGHVRYDRLSERPYFRDGIDRLVDGAHRFRVAIMCSEEDPTECHRRLLIGRVLLHRGVGVTHLRGDGRLLDEAQVEEAERLLHPKRYQSSLFGSKEEAWRSIRSVSASTARHSSSRP